MNLTTISVKPEQTKFALSPNMYGIFFEEVNHAGDGGLYAERVRNRNFCDARIPEGTAYYKGGVRTAASHYEAFSLEDLLPGWELRVTGKARGVMEPWLAQPRNPAVPNQLKLTASSLSEGAVELINHGYWGMAVAAEEYRLTLICRGQGVRSLRASLRTPAGDTVAETVITAIGDTFEKKTATLTAAYPADKCRLVLAPCEEGEVYFDFVSLFPVNTFCGRENGADPRLAGMIAALKPAFMRFPGGCIVEGISMENAFTFKRTVGPVEDRPGCWNLWGYRRTDGMGYHEYLQFCEDIGAEAMYVCNCGMSCQARNSQSADEATIQWFLQDAIDAIEYALAPITNPWGALRAQNGHPEPFALRYVEIGNENNGPDYERRYDRFYAELKRRFPDLVYIVNDSTLKDREEPNFDLIDEHFYLTPSGMAAITSRYDSYRRDGAKIYVGEYAANQEVGIGDMAAAAAEAAFLLHLESNGDVVTMASYAPLLCHMQNRQWPVNLICYEDSRVFGIPSYHVQKLFREQQPQTIVETGVETVSFTGEAQVRALGGLAADGTLIVKAVNFSAWPTEATLQLPAGYRMTAAYEVAADTPETENSPDEPEKVAAREIPVAETPVLRPYGVYVFRFEK